MSEVRVAVLLPRQNAFVSPGLGEPQLFRTPNEENFNPEMAAHTIVGKPEYGLPPMSSLHVLGKVEDVAGYALRPATGREINFRNFTVRRFDIDEILEHGDTMDPTDIAILSIAHSMARQWTGSTPAPRSRT